MRPPPATPSRDVAAWTLAALLSRPEISDEEAIALVLKHGYPSGAVARACAMLPIAFGRRILRTFPVTLSEDFVEVDAQGAVTRRGRLAEDAVYVQAAELAAHAGQEEIRRIGLRSGEVGALNQLLNAGGRPEGGVFGPPAFFGLEGLQEGGTDAQEMLDCLLRNHGSKLKGAARVFPRGLSEDRALLQLDVSITSPRIAGRQVLESFDGIGPTVGEATADAMQKFATGSAHALLATLEDERLGGDQVTWEDWGDFRACLGPALRLWSDTAHVDLGAYLDAVRDAVRAARLSPEIHWHRTFVGLKDGEITGLDSLIDNESWPPGETLARSWSWPSHPLPCAVRQLVVLVPANPPANESAATERKPGWLRRLFVRRPR